MFTLTEPWLSFLNELDALIQAPLCITCMGGFVVKSCYGLHRNTVDIDALVLEPSNQSLPVEKLAGFGSPLYTKHHVYIQQVPAIVTIPCDHQDRLLLLDTPSLSKITLYALEAHDLALSKLERNDPRDRIDVQHLAAQGHINAKTLIERYHEEHRLYLLGDLHRYDRTLNLWLNLCWPAQYPA